jgi:RND superfamily putative drug exporter
LGILLDTFLVRPVLVPAFVVLMDRIWNSDVPKPGPLRPAESESASEPTEAALAEAPASKGLKADAVDSILGQFYDPD